MYLLYVYSIDSSLRSRLWCTLCPHPLRLTDGEKKKKKFSLRQRLLSSLFPIISIFLSCSFFSTPIFERSSFFYTLFILLRIGMHIYLAWPRNRLVKRTIFTLSPHPTRLVAPLIHIPISFFLFLSAQLISSLLSLSPQFLVDKSSTAATFSTVQTSWT